jgi:hypothetical protein
VLPDRLGIMDAYSTLAQGWAILRLRFTDQQAVVRNFAIGFTFLAIICTIWALIDWTRLSSLYTTGARNSDPQILLASMTPVILWALIETLFTASTLIHYLWHRQQPIQS